MTPPLWQYGPYRATLRRDGKIFAIVTPDGTNALDPVDASILIDLLCAGETYKRLVEDTTK